MVYSSSSISFSSSLVFTGAIRPQMSNRNNSVPLFRRFGSFGKVQCKCELSCVETTQAASVDNLGRFSTSYSQAVWTKFKQRHLLDIGRVAANLHTDSVVDLRKNDTRTKLNVFLSRADEEETYWQI